MEHNTSSTATFSRKFSSIHKSFNSTSIYDGVFSNSSKFGVSSSFSSRAEDYAEIFSGSRDSRRSSIPVLDIPAVHERQVSADVRSSKLDYSAIFGGDFESMVSHEDLLAKSNNRGSLSKEARTQAYGRSHSEVSANNSIDENGVLSKGGSHVAYEKARSFNMSYDKVKPSVENGANGRTHIAQLHDVPGYTCLVEEARPSKPAKGERAVANDTSTTSKADEGLLKASDTQTSPNLPACSHNKIQTKEGAIGHKSSRTRSLSKDLLFDGYEFGLERDGVHSPSNFSSNLSKDKSDSGFSISPRSATEIFSGVYSPPDFGYEVDESSVAAACAAAVKKAIEIAEARIKLAKELMEKEKEMLRGNMSYKGNVRMKERRNGEMAKKLNKSYEEKAKEVCECLDTKRQMMGAPGKANSLDETLLDRDTGLGQRHISSSEVGQFTLEQEFMSIQEDSQQQELEDVATVNGLNRAAITDKAVSSEPKQGFTMKNIIQSGYEFFARNWTRAADKPLQKLVEDTKSPMAVEEAHSQKEVEKEQPAVKAPAEWLQSGRGRLDTENHGKKLASEQFHEEIAVMPTLLHDEGTYQEKLNIYNESALGKDLQTRELEVQMNSMKGLHDLKEKELEQIDAHKGGEENGSRNMFDGEQARSPSETSSVKEEDAEMWEESYERVSCGAKSEGGEQARSPSEASSAKEEDAEMQKESYERVSCGAMSEGTQFIEENKEDLNSSYSVADNSTSLHAFQQLEEHKERSKEFCGGRKSSCLREQSDLDDYNELREGRMDNKISDELNWTEVIDQQETHEGLITKRILTKVNMEAENESGESVDCQVDSIVTEPLEQDLLEFVTRTSVVLECDRTNENVHASINEVEGRENIRKENISLINLEGTEENLRKIADNHELDESCKSDSTNIAQNVLEVEEFQEQLKEENGALGFHENGIHISSTNVNEAHREDRSTEESPMMGNEEMKNWDSSRMNNEEKHEHSSVADTAQSEICINGEQQGGASISGENLDVSFADGVGCNDDDIYTEASDQPVFSERVEKPHDSECFDDNGWVDDDGNITFHIEEDQLSVSSERRGETMGIQHNSSQSFEDVSSEGEEETLEFHLETNSQQSFEKDDLYVEESEQPASSDRMEKAENLELIDDHRQVHDDSNFHIEEDRLSVSSEKKNEKIGLQHDTKSCQCFETLLSEGKEEAVQFPSIANSRQSFEANEENCLDTPKVEDKDTECSGQKEIKQGKNPEKEINVSKERERAREMERLAVERAIREVRERAFAEAREKAERAKVEKATAEARQRVMAHTREKLGKSPTDMNSRLAEKKSIEAKVRAERAAVERATAEARERALERAMSEKYAGAVKDNSIGQKFSSHDSQNNGSRPSINTRNQDPLDHNGIEGADGVKGESAERRKARLERHQRTAERAAKALAEKNMRDTIAQREQSERNRIAETLDADIRRWSSGKLGNLRALLSTLQYILGPDSGWQPVSLTEIITTAAVKKAYRKATLCVHPDKLQQRGATLQQKYICEKVFDLLKEAWNKFSAEER